MNPPNRYGVIDLGTNTFHLLIVDKEKTSFKIIFRQRVFVKLGQGGVEHIQKEPFERGVMCLLEFKKQLEDHQCNNIKCIGTAALRKSSNASEFIQEVENKTGFKIEVISGKQEAFLIYRGIQQVFSFSKNYSLIMDIGGGSVEFIIANNDGIVFCESIPMGIAILKNKFHHSNPMSNEEQSNLKEFYLKQTLELRTNLDRYKPIELIGSSGTFDVLNDNLTKQAVNESISKIDLDAYNIFAKKILLATTYQLKQWDAIPEKRVDLIAVAIQLINLTLETTEITTLFSSAYSLKEGLLDSIIF